MKTKFLLALLTLNSLLFYANSAFAATATSIEGNQKIANLSQTISKSINLDSGYHSLIESAINRALLAKGEKNNSTVAVGEPAPAPTSTPSSIVNGKVAQPTPKPVPTPDINITTGAIVNGTRNMTRRPIVNGKVAQPTPKPSVKPNVAGGITAPVSTTPSRPIINGKIANPSPSNPPVIINGIIKKVDPQPTPTTK